MRAALYALSGCDENICATADACALTPNLGRLSKSVGVKWHSALMKPSDTFDDKELPASVGLAPNGGALGLEERVMF